MAKYAATKIRLAHELGIKYHTLCDWFNEPDHPPNHSPGDTQYDIQAWREWIGRRTKGHWFTGNRGSSGNGQVMGQMFAASEREKALTAKAAVEAERATFKLAVERGEYLERQDVCNKVETVCSVVRRELNKRLLHEMPPRLEGLKASEMKRPMRGIVDQLADHLCNEFASYAVGAGGG